MSTPDTESTPNIKPGPNPSGNPPQVGSYRLIEQLGTGGMSSVFRAVHADSGHEVAIKILPRSLARNPTMLQRFLREAKSAESLQNPHIVEIFDRGSEDGRYYIVLEFMPGGDLHDWVRSRGPLSVGEVVEVIRSAALGLKHAAAQGLIHRDIKPANLLRTADGHVKVTDLGLALQLSDEDERVTRDGTTVGTVDYMAPEQARDSRATSVRSDIYSLGCTFYFLLTGQAPFPGGAVPEKLRRHAYEAAPDVRQIRPDVPEELAELIQRMMAKKPERRFVDYDHLLMALDELAIAPPREAPTAIIDDEPETRMPEGDEPLMALIDDEAESADQGDGGPPVASEEPVLTALIDDEDDDAAGSAGFTLGPPASGVAGPGSTKSTPVVPGRREPAPAGSGAEINLAALSGVEDESPGRSTRRRPPSGPELGDGPRSAPAPAPGRSRLPDPQAEPIPLLDHRTAEEGMEGPVTAPRPQEVTGTPLSVLLLRGALAGLVLVFLGIGVSHLLSAVGSRPGSGSAGIDLGRSQDAEAVPETIETIPDDGLGGLAVGLPHRVAGRQAPASWSEPVDRREHPSELPKYPTERVEALGLGNAEPGRVDMPPSPIVVVNRAAEVHDREHQRDLQQAFDTISGTVEIDDDGPIFEHDFRVHGRERLIRAGTGRRPIVVVRPSKLASVRSRPAVVVLDDTSLTIEGIDLVVRASDLTPNQRALFLCLDGSELTLRDCTITVEGPIERPLAVVQVGVPAKPGQNATSTVRLERTLVRGPGLTAVWLAEGPAEVVVSRSAVLAGDAPVFNISGGAKPERALKLLGSIVATSGPVIELAGMPAGPAARPLTVRALGTTFARAEGGGTSGAGLVMLREPPNGGPKGPGVDWQGDHNRFDGWSPVASAGANRPVALADLEAIRRASPASDAASRAVGNAWSSATQAGWISPADLIPPFSELEPILAHVAAPTPNLRAWSLDAFDRLPVAVAGGIPDAKPAGPGVQVIDFDADQSPDSGDLGRYLATKVRPQTTRVVVNARGAGWHPFSPIRMAEGVSLELRVPPPASGREEDRLVFRPAEGARGAALIQVRGADLTILGACFERDACALLKQVIRVEQGHLNLLNCRLLAPGSVETGGGGLVEFRSQGTRPLPSGSSADWPLATLTDCVLITGGDALTADLGRGVVSLRNCALASGSDAIVLRPQPVARSRFAADLWLERCTVVSEGNLVRLESWPGGEAGPDRPWLIASHDSAFLDTYDRGRTPSTTVLLRADAEALSRGTVLWQSTNDAYHLSHYLIGGLATPQPVSFPEIGKLWVDVWGPSHIRNPRTDASGVRFVSDRLTPGEVTPADLVLQPDGPRSRGRAEVGADLERLGITPSARR